MKTYTEQEVKEASLKFFDGDELAADVFLKYALYDNKNGVYHESTPDDMFHRLAKEFKRIENKYPNPLSEEVIYSYLKDFSKIVAQGSPMSAVGNNFQFQTVGNCYVIESPNDSYGSILRADQEIVQISKRRGGVGLDISKIRPKGMPTNNAAKTTDGIGVFMDRFSNSIREVGQCIAKGEKVLTKGGIKNIEDVVEQIDEVWTKKGWVKVKKLFKNGKKNIIKTTTLSGYEIKTSKDHIFLGISDDKIVEKKIEDFEVGDRIILIPGSKPENKNYIKLEKNEYQRKDSGGNSSKLNVDVKNPDLLNENLAYILGYSYGDGSIEKDKFGEVFALSLACSDSWPKIKDLLKENIKRELSYDVSVSRGDGKLDKLNIFSKILMNFFEKNEILKQKSGQLIFPKKILQSPASVQSAFIAGYFDADGYASGRKKGYVFSSIRHSFLKEIQLILSSFGIMSKIYCENREDKKWQNLYSLCVVGKTSQEKFLQNIGEYSVKVKQVSHVSKRDCWTTPYNSYDLGINYNKYNFINNKDKISYQAFLKLKDENNLDEALLDDEIISILDTEELEETYDLSLETEHLFWCQGFYVHNSGRRGALLISINCHHPEIETFINIKKDKKRVTGANISIQWTDEFMKAVEKDEMIQLRFPVQKDVEHKIEKFVSAKEIWDKFVESAWESAEPGCAFIDTIWRYTPSDIYEQFRTLTSNPCVVGETWVLTEEGPRQVKELLNKKHNLYIDGNIYNTLNGFYSTGTKKVFCLKTKEGYSVKLTKDHKVFTGQGWKKAKDIVDGDKIRIHQHKNVEWEGDGSQNDGYLLGLLIGDGTFSSNGEKNKAIISIWEDEDDGHLSMMNRVNEAFERFPKRSDFIGFGKIDHSHFSPFNQYNISCASFTEMAKKYGIVKGNKRLTDEIEKGSSSFYKGILSGLFDSDGSVQGTQKKGISVRLSQINKDVLVRAQRMLSRLGIKSVIYKRKDAGTKMLPDSNRLMREYPIQELFELVVSNDCLLQFREIIGFCHSGKKNKLDTLLSLYKRNLNETNYFVSFDSLEECGEEEVYDVNVEEVHSFDANGIYVHNCGEIYMNNDSCRLMLVNLYNFILNKFKANSEFDFKEFDKVVQIAQRLMDDLVDLELEKIDKILEKISTDPEPKEEKEIELNLWKKFRENCVLGRRTGLGITALGDALAALNIKYGSENSLVKTEEIYKALCLGAYRSSVKLAEERGAFPMFDLKLELANPFIQQILNEDEELRKNFIKFGRRNIAITTTAPAGSVSTETQTTSGIEPAFMLSYKRRRKVPKDNEKVDFIDESGDAWVEYEVFHKPLLDWKNATGLDDIKQSPYYGATANEIDALMSVRQQAIAQKWVCHSISRTVNLPSSATKEQVNQIYMEGWKTGCKGITVYRDGCRTGVLVSTDDKKEEKSTFIDNQAPKRPEVLECDIHRANIQGEKWVVLVGLLNGRPYEVFAGLSNKIELPKKFNKGRIIKHSKKTVRSSYDLKLGEGDEELTIKDIIGTFNNPNNATITRFISLSLRHGSSVRFVVEQLQKDEADDFTSFTKVVGRTLKKYIQDGQQVSSDKVCWSCGEEGLVYQDGCVSCKSCGSSKC